MLLLSDHVGDVKDSWSVVGRHQYSHWTLLAREDVCRAHSVVYFNTKICEQGSAEVTKHQKEDRLNQESLVQETQPN